jgi:uncharacterized membrane protein HdeD (DUF308 family)
MTMGGIDPHMAETVLVTVVGASAAAVGLLTVVFALYSRRRPRLLQGPLVSGVSLLTVGAGVAVLLVGEAAHGAGLLVYVGGVVALVGVAVLTGVVAAVPDPEGESEAGAGH